MWKWRIENSKLQSKKSIYNIKLEVKCMTEEIEFLKNVPLFSGLSQKEINTIGNIAHKKVFHKNNIILQKGDEGEALYIILSCRIKVTFLS